jgi:hypothetical protein
MDSPKPDEPTSSKFVDVDVKFGKLIEGEALLGPSKSFEDMENSRTKEETEDSHEPIFHPPNSDDNTCNQENIKHVGDESESEKVRILHSSYLKKMGHIYIYIYIYTYILHLFFFFFLEKICTFLFDI